MHKADGSWTPVSTDLRHNPDGTLAPAAAVSDVTFANGGSGPFATWRSGGSTFTLGWPSALPAPRIEGDTAVYPEVLSGVDLHVTALADQPFTEESVRELIQLPRAFGGTFDAHDDILAGLAVPRSADWKAFASALERYCKRYSGDYWNASAAPPGFRGPRQ